MVKIPKQTSSQKFAGEMGRDIEKAVSIESKIRNPDEALLTYGAEELLKYSQQDRDMKASIDNGRMRNNNKRKRPSKRNRRN